MLDIYCQIQLLAVAYGDNLASVFESASYMVSTMSAAFDYLSSPHFGKWSTDILYFIDSENYKHVGF